jgi:uroporphyrinogen-III synthase
MKEYDSAMRKKDRTRDAHLPLLGATVVVTRPATGSQALKRRVAHFGGSAIGLPGVSLRSMSDKRAIKASLVQARAGDIVVFISPAAVRYAFAIHPKLRFTKTTLICTLGAATEQALRRKGIKNVLWPCESQTSEGLLALPELQRLRAKRVTIIGAPGGRELLAQSLTARKARVTAVHVYRRETPRFRRDQLDALERATAPIITMLTSQEVLENLRAALPLPLFGKLVEGELIVSSLRLAMVARASLFTSVHIAASPSPDDLIHAACGALAQHRL